MPRAKRKPKAKRLGNLNIGTLTLTLAIFLIGIGLVTSIVGLQTFSVAYHDSRQVMEYQFSIIYFSQNPSEAFSAADKTEREQEITVLNSRADYSQIVGSLMMGFSGVAFGLAGILISAFTSINIRPASRSRTNKLVS